MHPFLFLMLALATPFALCLSLLVPVYLSLFAAVYAVYFKTAGHAAVLAKADDIFYIVGAYTQLFNYWQAHMFQVSFFTYTLPVIFLPFLSIVGALWLTRRLVRKLGDVFQVNVLSE
jgi:hypothetical protein